MLWTPDDVDRLLTATQGTRLEAAWHLVAIGGIRVGELLALTWSDVDFEASRLTIRDAVVGVPYSAIAPEPSSNRTRRVDLDRGLVGQLTSHLARQQSERSEWGAYYSDSGLVVCRENGRTLHPRSLGVAFDAAVARSGLEPAPLSSLRLASERVRALSRSHG
ncbi:MAG: tyrosine-type recombinase/integrase [Solirubrobacterales bacterium]